MKTQTWIRIGAGLTFALIGLLIAAAAGEDRRMAEREVMHRARAVERGADLYDANCRTCHGARGEGVGQLGPALSDAKFFTGRLAEVGWQDTLESYVTASSSHGRLAATRPMYAGNGTTAVMAPWSEVCGGPLRDDQIRDIAAFVLNWKPTALGQVTLAELALPRRDTRDPGFIAKGRAVFIETCARCHAFERIAAKEKGPDLTRIAADAADRAPGMSAEDYIRESVLLPQAHIAPEFDSGAAPLHCGAVLSASNLDAVTAFLLASP